MAEKKARRYVLNQGLRRKILRLYITMGLINQIPTPEFAVAGLCAFVSAVLLVNAVFSLIGFSSSQVYFFFSKFAHLHAPPTFFAIFCNKDFLRDHHL